MSRFQKLDDSGGEEEEIEEVARSDDASKQDGSSSSGRGDGVDGGWKCSSCTFINHRELGECEICSVRKPQPLGSTRNSSSKSGGGGASTSAAGGGGDGVANNVDGEVEDIAGAFDDIGFKEVKRDRASSKSKGDANNARSADAGFIIDLIEESKNIRLDSRDKFKMPKNLHRHIQIPSPKYFYSDSSSGKYTTYTLTLKLPSRFATEDAVYAENPDLLFWISRAHTIVMKGNSIIGTLEGPTKFSGKESLDEDPDDDANGNPGDEVVSSNTANKIYDHDKVLSWKRNKQLKIIRTTKENGKFAIMTVMVDPHTKEPLIVFGSKNYHLVVKESNFFEQSFEGSGNNVIRLIYESIKLQYAKIKEVLMPRFLQGYSLVGESCDGQHFTDGDGQIKWFGLFKNGSPLDVVSTLSHLREKGLSTVDFAQIYDSSTPGAENIDLDSLYLESRCMDGEGCVLYNINSETNETILVKTKSVQYIVKRMLREKIKNGCTKIDTIRARFVDAKTYHGLNTAAAVRITGQLISFGIWMMNKSFPGAVLGHSEVKSVRGQLPNGFNTYWQKYISENPTGNLVISKSDFGALDEQEYLERTKPYPGRDLHKNTVVVFIQGIQGSGKSTIAHTLKETLCEAGIKTKIVEQDICYGDTLTCQSQLFHWSSDGEADVLIVSRCNVNENQYKRYLAIAEERFCKVIFFSPHNFDELYFAISIAGIINRSNEGDKLLIGRFELDIDDVIAFTYRNFLEYEKYKSTDNTYDSYSACEAKLLEVRAIIKSTFPDRNKMLSSKESPKFDCSRLKEFVRDNFEQLHALRRSVHDIIQSNLLDKVRDAVHSRTDDVSRVLAPPRLENCLFIGLFLNFEQKARLIEFARPHVTITQYLEYCEHVTYNFKPKDAKHSLPAPFSMVEVSIDSLIVAPNGYLVYNVSSIKQQNGNSIAVQSGFPHITCFTPLGGQPKDSIGIIKEKSGRRIPCDFNIELKVLFAFPK